MHGRMLPNKYMHNDPHIIEEVEINLLSEEEEDLMVEEEVEVPTKVSLIIFMFMRIIKEIEKLMI